MFEWLLSLGGNAASLRPVAQRFNQMLVDGLHMFDMAANAVLGGTETEIIRNELYAADQRINRNEQKLRRGLITHASVHGATEFPSCLVLMSIAKDAERIGDYCKNLFELAASGRITTDLAEYESLLGVKNQLATQLRRLIKVYTAQDVAAATAYLTAAEDLQKICDNHIDQIIAGKHEGKRPVISALAFRYFKRISAHARNIVSSIIRPVDLLNYDDED
ncbi:MAG: hypothetical protein CMJ85_06700 [Planctomycetes bacterium]|nr:hypothetical protein [Planctomycetota bacterium]